MSGAANSNPHRVKAPHLKAGAFLLFSLALFLGMVFVLGNFDRRFKARQEIRLVFAKLNGLPQDAPVYYNGMQAGRVKSMRLRTLTPDILQRMPAFTINDLNLLPLMDAERSTLRENPPADAAALDRRVRELILGRNVSVLLLDLAQDSDSSRYRIDDEYQITGSLTGDRALAIRSGSGAAVPANYDKFFLGNSGDMYTDLGKSVEQVRDILNSMAEAVGGDSGPAAIQGQLANFDLFTRRIEETVGGLETDVPETWDAIDGRLEAGRKQMDEVQTRLTKIEPDLQKVLDDAGKTMAEMRADVDKSVTPLADEIKDGRKSAKETLGEAGKSIARMREKFPAQIRDGRAWIDQFTPSVEKIENAMDSAKAALSENSESSRAALQGAVERAQSLEETSYRLKTKPHAAVSTLESADEKVLEQEWRRALLERQYVELRAELELMRKDAASLNAASAGKIDQILKSIESALNEGGSGESIKRKEKR